MRVMSLVFPSLFLLFSLGVSIHASFSDENYYVFLQFWYFSSENVHQSYLSLDLLAAQNNAAKMSTVGEFDLCGTNQYVRLWIDSYPMSNQTQWTGLTIQVKGTFLDINGSREYSQTYNDTVVVMPEPIKGVNRNEYFCNFTNEIQQVKGQVYPEQPLGNIGIYGSLTLENTIHEIVGQVGTKRYVKLALHAYSESPYGWVLLPSIRIPETAQWQIAKIDTEDMIETFPDLRQTTLTTTPGQSNDHEIYAVWQTPTPISWQEQMTKWPISLAWSFCIGLVAGLSSKYIADKLHKKKRSTIANDTTHSEPKPQQEHGEDNDLQRLVKFVDDNFDPIRLKDVLKASPFFKATIIVLIILLVYLVGLSPFTPIVYQIPWAISFVALLLTTASLAKALQREVQMSLVKLRMEQMCLRLGPVDERTKCLLYALLIMKIRNSNLKLSLLYEIDRSLFETEKLLGRVYEI